MATRPAQDFTWATSGSLTDPGATKKDQGFVVAERPPARWINYLFNLIAQWLTYLDEKEEIAYIPAISGDAPSGTNFSRQTTHGVVSITGTQTWIIPIRVDANKRIESVSFHVVWGSVPPSAGTIAFHLRRLGQDTLTTMATFTIAGGEVAGPRVIDLPVGANLPEDVQADSAAYFFLIDNAAVVAGTPHEYESLEVTFGINSTL